MRFPLFAVVVFVTFAGMFAAGGGAGCSYSVQGAGGEAGTPTSDAASGADANGQVATGSSSGGSSGSGSGSSFTGAAGCQLGLAPCGSICCTAGQVCGPDNVTCMAGPDASACNASNCSGCCSLTNGCQVGNTVAFCGSAGTECTFCSDSTRACIAGQCQ